MNRNDRRLDIIVPNRDGYILTLSPLLRCHEGKERLDGVSSSYNENRFSLLCDFCDIIRDDLIAGGSVGVAKTRICTLTQMVRHIDRYEGDLCHETVGDEFVKWVGSRLGDVRNRKVKQNTVYGQASRVASLIAQIFNQRTSDLLRRARIQRSRKSPGFIVGDQHKQNLEKTFAMGHVLVDVCTSLSVEVIRGPIPVILNFRDGTSIEDWCRRCSPKGLKSYDPNKSKLSRVKAVNQRRAAVSADSSVKARFSLINLRIEAELLVFISQTGMNLGQAKQLRISSFSYESFSEGYLVRRVYKERRKGEVEFQIYTEYRAHFSHYLKWLKRVIPTWDSTCGLVFPFIAAHRDCPKERPAESISFLLVRNILRKLDKPFVGPRLLRKTRVNWMLRRSCDEDLTSEQAQHTKKTLIDVYEIPNHQRSMVEAMRFWRETDSIISTPAPGSCVEMQPSLADAVPSAAPRPDCANPAGCLFCDNHRDLDTFDHVWSLSSYRYLKTVEQSKYIAKANTSEGTPSSLVIQRLSQKLAAFSDRGAGGGAWVIEALSRLDEGHFHPAWCGFIRLAEEGTL